MCSLPSEELFQPVTQNLKTELGKKCRAISSRPRNEKKFLPCNFLETLVTVDTVKNVLQEAKIEESERETMENYVLSENSRRLFLILVLMTSERENCLSLLGSLIQERVTDADLPLEFDEENSRGYAYSANEIHSERRIFLSGWHNEWCLFDFHQWKLCAPVFTGEKFLYHFAERQILPFFEDPETKPKSGSFGDVRRVEIPATHIAAKLVTGYAPSSSGHFAIAIKTTKHVGVLDDFFNKEKDNLQGLQDEPYDLPGLIKPIAAYELGKEQCLMFPWADGGNLSELWQNNEHMRSNTEGLAWLIEQFKVMFSALETLHLKNFRHGDLKPENILWFKNSGGGTLGSLKISDMGLSRFHQETESTKERNWQGKKTTTPSGTVRYKPPGEDESSSSGQLKSARSRQYDIWSMGCIMLDLLVWMMHGVEALNLFKQSTATFWTEDACAIEPRVVQYMDTMDDKLDHNTAHKCLLRLVRDRLLVVRVCEDYRSEPGCREIAAQVHATLEDIHQRCLNEDGYLSIVDVPYPLPQTGVVYEGGGQLTVPDAKRQRRAAAWRRSLSQQSAPDEASHKRTVVLSTPDKQGEGQDADGPPMIVLRQATINVQDQPNITSMNSLTMSDNQEYNMFQSSKLNDVWDASPDNDFASRFFGKISWDRVKPPRRDKSDVALCSRCRAIDSARLFGSPCLLSGLEQTARSCELCALLCEALQRWLHRTSATTKVWLRQEAGVVSVVGVNGVEKRSPNLLSVYATPSSRPVPAEAQLGLPQLLEAGSPEQFTLLKEWIRECDSTHSQCTWQDDDGGGGTSTMPKRLIRLGEPLQLVDVEAEAMAMAMATGTPLAYVALSHCWGKLSEAEKLCTYRASLAQMEAEIPWPRMPRTFRDAVTVARGIGAAYLWIDSLCIVQDDADDWAAESAKMGHVFSAAYCTIAATSAPSSLAGFLHSRPPPWRACVPIEIASSEAASEAGTLYVCPHRDDFHKDVELGELNTRGWVLQERVLSRRTIFFTSTQVYWMCGATVRTETLGRLWNAKAAFLGDAHFPRSALEYYRDGRQMLVLDLYERYASLAFTKNKDRPVAILGLQERLATAFKTRAAYGFLALYFPRLLLWRRWGSRRMVRIVQPPGSRHHPPSWSWFSKDGPIQYMQLKFQAVLWATAEFENPFRRQNDHRTAAAAGSPAGAMTTLYARARRLLHMTRQDMFVSVIWDEAQEYGVDDLRCVVIGRDKTESSRPGSARCHVLIIRQVPARADDVYYERVGAASLGPEHVADEAAWVTIR